MLFKVSEGWLYYEFFEKEYDGEKISPKTVLKAQPNNGKLQSRFSTYVKNGEECQFTTEQKKIFADLFTLKNGKSKSNKTLLAVFSFFYFHWIYFLIGIKQQY